MTNKLQLCVFLFLLSVSIQAQQIKVSFSPKAFEGDFSGKVILYHLDIFNSLI